jgi:predicted phosphodiesterase
VFDVNARLSRLYEAARRLPLDDASRIVIISDLHLGNGGRRDDFVRNAVLCGAALREYYLPRGFHLLLNGDTEELQRYRRARVRQAWPAFFDLLRQFREGGGCTRIAGNHDVEAATDGEAEWAVRLVYGAQTLFVFHGHQAAAVYERFNRGVGLVLRYLAKPLHIGNHSVSHSSERRFKIERRVYEYSIRGRIASIIGHTHRPLFETMSKVDSLKYRIETLCRRYPEAPQVERERMAAYIVVLRRELGRTLARHSQDALPSRVYGTSVHVPCLFNSGCCIGKSGITSIEIVGGRIALVHWFDAARRMRGFVDGAVECIAGNSVRRRVLREDSLRYVFARIGLLAGADEPTTDPPEDGVRLGAPLYA